MSVNFIIKKERENYTHCYYFKMRRGVGKERKTEENEGGLSRLEV